MKTKSLLLLGVAAIAITYVALHEPKKPTPAEQVQQQAQQEQQVQAALPPRYRAMPTIPGNYLSARFALSNDDLVAASDFYGKAIEAAGDNTDKAFLTERALPALIGAGYIGTAIEIAKQVDPAQKTATGQLAVLLQMVEGFKNKDSAAVERLLPLMQTDGFGRLLKPLVETWVFVGKKDDAAALSTLHILEKAYPSISPLVQMHLGFVNDYAGNNVQAAHFYKAAIKDNFSVRTTYVVGKFYERIGEKDKAVQLYKTLAEKMPSAPPMMALQRIQQGDLNKAKFIRNPSDGIAAALYDVATVLHQENSSRLAVLYAQMAHYLAPDDEFSTLLLGDIMSLTLRPTQAETYYTSISKDSDLYTLSQMRLSQLYEQQGDIDKSVAILEETGRNPLLARQAAMELGDLYRRQENFAKALPYYTKVIEQTDKPNAGDWVSYYARGICYERTNEWEKAEADLETALKLSPEQPEVLNYLAYSWADHGKNTEKALEMLMKALAGAPNDPYITDSVGWALFKNGRAKDAVPYLENAVQQLPDDPVINDHLGDVYAAIGRKLEAHFQWERSLKNAKDSEADLRASLAKKLDIDPAANLPKSDAK